MKYAKFSDDFLSDFRLDDNGETLVLTDKRGYTRAVKLLPYEEIPKCDLADEVWKLYEKHHSHLATHVLEFGYELKELLGKYQKGGAE